MSRLEAERKLELFAAVAAALSQPGAPAHCAWFVPGRVEVLGKHTDYAGGRSLVCATERGFCFAGRQLSVPRLVATSSATGERIELPLDPSLPLPPAGWPRFAAVVVRRL